MKFKLISFILLFCSGVFSQALVPQASIPYKTLFPEIKSPVSINIHYLGQILIGDDFSNQLFAVDPVTMTLKRASSTSNFSSLSNPVAIASDPLNIFVLDYDNQKLFRYDINLRLISELNLETIYNFPDDANIIFMNINFKKEIYLLNEADFNIIKLNNENNIISTFGGKTSSILEFLQISKIINCGKNGFLTYDEVAETIIKFELTGNLIWKIQVKDPVLDFTANFKNYWILLLGTNDLLIGKDKQVISKLKLPVLSENNRWLISMAPEDDILWLLGPEELLSFKLVLE